MLAANYIDVDQQSPEWMEMRKGMATGSMSRHATAKLAASPSLAKKCQDGKHETCQASHCICSCHGPRNFYQKCRQDYLEDVVTTRITGVMSDRYVSKAMEEGIEREPDALMAYEDATGEMVLPGGFVYHPDIEWFGTSPDGLIGASIVIEAKCPTQTTHFRYLREHKESIAKGLQYVPEDYLPQIKSHLSCTGRSVCHFISFNPHFPKHMRLLVSAWDRDNGAIAEQDAEICKFLKEAAEMEKEWKA